MERHPSHGAATADPLDRGPFPSRFRLGDHEIGAGPVFVIAEGGVNHDGDPAVAVRLVEAAAGAGADAVKFQTFDPDALAAVDAPKAGYQAETTGAEGTQREMLRRLALPVEAWPELRDRATALGLVFLSTPFDEGSADLLDELGVPGFKVGSGELTNLPFLASLARRGRPLLLSTGMADLDEVGAALETVAEHGHPPTGLLHCVSSYPADPGDANLRAIETMRVAFGVPVGWSDHTLGIETTLAAVAAGATIVEKHLTLDRTADGPDHRASLEPADFAAMVTGIRSVEAMLGTGEKRPTAAEADVAAVARRSLHWRTDRPSGATVTSDDLVALRPGTGLAPGIAPNLVGRRLRVAVSGGSMVSAEQLEPGG